MPYRDLATLLANELTREDTPDTLQLIEGLRGATADGAELTKDSFVAALEAIDGLPGQGWINTISFSAEDHTAPADVREVTWDTACPCWKASSDWMPISDFE